MSSKVNVHEADIKLVNAVSSCFLIYMLTLYPLFMHDGYFDITLTKFTLLRVGILIYGFLMIIGIFMLETDKLSLRSTEKKKYKGSFMVVDICGFMFLLSGFLAFLNAPVKSAAYTGINGRRCGLQFLLLMAVMYIMLSYSLRLVGYIFQIFAAVSSFTYVIAILQHLGFDVFGLLENVTQKQQHMFVSTFGNINTFAGFICVSLPLFFGLYIFAGELKSRITYGITIGLGFAAIIASDSDCAYAGCGAAIVAFLFVAVYNRKKLLYLQTAIYGSFGYTLMAVITKYMGEVPDDIEGFSVMSTCIGALVVITSSLIVIYILCKLFGARLEMPVRCQMLIVAIVIFISIIVFVIYGVSQEIALFTFDDSWGTYRGYVWIRLMELYKDFSLKDKLIGYGNETIAALMNTNYYAEMNAVTGTVYDNAHNEYLQYLITMGILGAASFVALLVSTIVMCFKRAKNNPVLWALALSVISYAAQAAFNVNQSITTPYLFLFISVAAGIVRAENKGLKNM